MIERLPHALREFAPDRLADQVFGCTLEHLGCALVDIGVAPILIERDEAIGNAHKNFTELLLRYGGRRTSSFQGFECAL